MNNRLVLYLGLLLVLWGQCHIAYAWSSKEHILITRTAVRELLDDPSTPEGLKQWLRQAQPQLGSAEDEREFLINRHVGVIPMGVDGLAFWSVMPDVWGDIGGRDKKVAPFNVSEQQLHFVDLEYLLPKEADRVFAADLSHKPKLAEIPRDMKDPRWEKAGMLPFRIEDCYQRTVTLMKAGRLVDKPGQFPRGETAVKWAGCLAHYAADNAMPMHATADYQAYSFFPNVDKKPKVHFDMEYKLVDDENKDYPEIRVELWTQLAAELASVPRPDASDDLWTASLKLSLRSYDALPLIGQAAQAAYLDKDGNLKAFDADTFVHFTGEYEGRPATVLQMKARQMVLGVKWVEMLWLRAWQESRAGK